MMNLLIILVKVKAVIFLYQQKHKTRCLQMFSLPDEKDRETDAAS